MRVDSLSAPGNERIVDLTHCTASPKLEETMNLDPHEAVVALAAKADDLSRRMRDEATHLLSEKQDPRWTGSAATAQSHRTEEAATRARLTAGELDDLASALRNHAATASERYHDLARVLTQVNDYFAEANHGLKLSAGRG